MPEFQLNTNPVYGVLERLSVIALLRTQTMANKEGGHQFVNFLIDAC
jgi:hypothetical protein